MLTSAGTTETLFGSWGCAQPAVPSCALPCLRACRSCNRAIADTPRRSGLVLPAQTGGASLSSVHFPQASPFSLPPPPRRPQQAAAAPAVMAGGTGLAPLAAALLSAAAAVAVLFAALAPEPYMASRLAQGAALLLSVARREGHASCAGGRRTPLRPACRAPPPRPPQPPRNRRPPARPAQHAGPPRLPPRHRAPTAAEPCCPPSATPPSAAAGRALPRAPDAALLRWALGRVGPQNHDVAWWVGAAAGSQGICLRPSTPRLLGMPAQAQEAPPARLHGRPPFMPPARRPSVGTPPSLLLLCHRPLPLWRRAGQARARRAAGDAGGGAAAGGLAPARRPRPRALQHCGAAGGEPAVRRGLPAALPCGGGGAGPPPQPAAAAAAGERWGSGCCACRPRWPAGRPGGDADATDGSRRRPSLP